jgi:nucleoside 2-deoxyribosyltransferase
VKKCDGIFAIVNGTPPDEGVMVELGVAIALNKAIFLFRDDFRRCTDSERYPLNLMLFSGLPEVGWEDYYYTSVEEIQSDAKALYRWLTGK